MQLYIYIFLSGLHVSTYFLGHHQVLLVCYLFRSLCKANIDFVEVDVGIAYEQFSFCIFVFMDGALTGIYNLLI